MSSQSAAIMVSSICPASGAHLGVIRPPLRSHISRRITVTISITVGEARPLLRMIRPRRSRRQRPCSAPTWAATGTPNGGVIEATDSPCPRRWQRHRYPQRLSSTAVVPNGMSVLPRPSEQSRWPAAVPSGPRGQTVRCHLSHTAARHPPRHCATHTHLRRGPSSSTAALRSSSAPTAPVAESARARVAAASACCDSAASLAHPSPSSTGAHGSSRTGPPAMVGVCRDRTQRAHTRSDACWLSAASGCIQATLAGWRGDAKERNSPAVAAAVSASCPNGAPWSVQAWPLPLKKGSSSRAGGTCMPGRERMWGGRPRSA
eukprot:COSAG01_NODE_229_length_21089_cov_575.019194_31_plen_318_part_00